VSPTLEHRELWQQKKSLRAIYGDYYRRIAKRCRPGRTLEIGGGSGNFKDYLPETLSMDVQSFDWLDLVADAHRLPFSNGSFANLVMIDALHHLERPGLFLREAARVLQSGGRVIMIEPAITPLSWPVYTFLHPEPVDLADDPLAPGDLTPNRDPFAANQAIPTLLFGRHRARLAAEIPDLMLLEFAKFSLISYPLSGGFRPWSLLPAALAPTVIKLEDALSPLLAPLMAFRLLAVLARV
jgi:SAM-dependent methyltransferase